MKKENIEHPLNTDLIRKNIDYLIDKNGIDRDKMCDEIGISKNALSNYTGNKRVANFDVIRSVAAYLKIDENLLSNFDLEEYEFEYNPNAITDETYERLIEIIKKDFNISTEVNIKNIDSFFDIYLKNRNVFDNKHYFHNLIFGLKCDKNDVIVNNAAILYLLACKYMLCVFDVDYIKNISKKLTQPLEIRKDFIIAVEKSEDIRKKLNNVTIEYETDIINSLSILRNYEKYVFFINTADLIFYFFMNPKKSLKDKETIEKLTSIPKSLKSKESRKTLYNVVKEVYKYKKLKLV